jgi:hypothetical protein
MAKSGSDDESPLWLTVAKLLIVATVLIGGVGAALWYAGQNQDAPAPSDASSVGTSWGIANDSPLKSKR